MTRAFRLGPLEDGTVISAVDCLIPGTRFPVKDMKCCYCRIEVATDDKNGIGIIMDVESETAHIAHMDCLKKDPAWSKKQVDNMESEVHTLHEHKKNVA